MKQLRHRWKKQKLTKLSGRNIQKYLSCNGEAKQLLQEAISAAMAEQATSKTDCETLEGHPQCEKKLKEVQTTFSCSLFPDGVPGKRDNEIVDFVIVEWPFALCSQGQGRKGKGGKGKGQRRNLRNCAFLHLSELKFWRCRLWLFSPCLIFSSYHWYQ